MKLSQLVLLASVALASGISAPLATAQQPDWLVRCRLQLAGSPNPETGMYFFQTAGKADAAKAKATYDYNSGVSARAATYPGAAKDLLNPYSQVSIAIGYVSAADGKGPPAVGHISPNFIGKNFSAIPGSPITIRMIVGNATFGPYEPKPVSSGMYSIWLDTAETDGDSKPPILNPADFAKLAKAVDGASTLDVALVQDGAEIVRATIPLPQNKAWRDGLAAWASKTRPGVGAATSCPGGGEIVN